jgi:hypothetical protein
LSRATNLALDTEKKIPAGKSMFGAAGGDIFLLAVSDVRYHLVHPEIDQKIELIRTSFVWGEVR